MSFWISAVSTTVNSFIYLFFYDYSIEHPYCVHCFNCYNYILTLNSSAPLLLLRFPHLNETATKVIFKPHKNWKEMMLNPSLIDMFFKVLDLI